MQRLPHGCKFEEVIRALILRAHLVQGCWIACSAFRCDGNIRLEQFRDAILLQFARHRRVKSEELR